jgi:hypothetical protein
MNDLSNFIRQRTLDVLRKEVAEKVKEILYDSVDKLLYDEQDPYYYHRTYDLINSITIGEVKKIGKNEHEIEIYFDSRKIIPREDTTSRWNQHMSSDGYNTQENTNIAYWMNYGHKGLYTQEPLLFVENAKEILENNNMLLNYFKKALKAKGFTVK